MQDNDEVVWAFVLNCMYITIFFYEKDVALVWSRRGFLCLNNLSVNFCAYRFLCGFDCVLIGVSSFLSF